MQLRQLSQNVATSTTPVQNPFAAAAAASNQASLGQTIQNNPFFMAMRTQDPGFMQQYGNNQRLAKPAYFTQHKGRAIFAGSQLFVLA